MAPTGGLTTRFAGFLSGIRIGVVVWCWLHISSRVTGRYVAVMSIAALEFNHQNPRSLVPGDKCERRRRKNEAKKNYGREVITW